MLSLDQCIKANRPMTFVVAESDLEVLQHINDNFKEGRFHVYSKTLTNIINLQDLLNKKFSVKSGKASSTIDVLDQILAKDFASSNKTFETFIFLDSDNYIHDAQNIRKIKDILSRYQLDVTYTVNLIFISQTVSVPAALERLGEMVFFDLPSIDILKEVSNKLSSELDLKGKKKPSDEIINNLKGLTKFEVEQAYLQSFTIHEGIDIGFIRDFKKNAIAKTDLLSLLETDITFNEIGGMENLKAWIQKSYGGWTVEGKNFGLPLLKGLLLVGLPGCGKSLICKAIGNEWGLPIIQLDPSRIFSSRVGDSEANMRRVLKIIENIAPCLMGDSRITLANGNVASIKELYDNNYRDEVISINNSFEFEKSRVNLITKKISDDLYNVRTSIGNIKATGNHRFPVLKSNGEMHWIPVNQLSQEDFIVCPRKIQNTKMPHILDYFEDDTKIYSEKFCKEVLIKARENDYDYYKKHSRRITRDSVRKKTYRGFVFKHELIRFKINLSDLSHIYKISFGGGGYRDSFVTKVPSQISEDLCYLLGLLWSDGNIGDKGYWYYDSALKGPRNTPYRTKDLNTTKFYNNEKVLHDTLNTILSNEFNVELGLYNSKTSKNIITGDIPVIISKFLRKLQKDLISLPDRYIWAWLSGVLDGDGHVHKERINYAAKKHLNNEYLRDVLLRVGFPSTLSTDNFKSFRLDITSSKKIELFGSKLKLRHPKKSNDLSILIEKRLGNICRMDTLDVREQMCQTLIEKDLISEMQPITCKGDNRYQHVFSVPKTYKRPIHEYLDRKRYITYDKIKEIFEMLDCKNQWYFNNNFFFSQVKSVDKIQGFHEVYDLCLNKNHNFIANRMFTHNCVLFVDEVEKGFAGMQSSTFSDAGVTARVIGSFLIWLQECQEPIFTVATSNNIQYLPPELISRFDETFFVNLPQFKERIEIFKIHMKKLKKDPDKVHIEALAQAAKDLSGREIEQALKEAMYDAFYKKNELTTDVILNVLTKKTNLLTTMAEQLDFVLKWVGWDEDKQDGIRARFANPVESKEISRVQDEIEKLIKDVEDGGPLQNNQK